MSSEEYALLGQLSVLVDGVRQRYPPQSWIGTADFVLGWSQTTIQCFLSSEVDPDRRLHLAPSQSNLSPAPSTTFCRELLSFLFIRSTVLPRLRLRLFAAPSSLKGLHPRERVGESRSTVPHASLRSPRLRRVQDLHSASAARHAHIAS